MPPRERRNRALRGDPIDALELVAHALLGRDRRHEIASAPTPSAAAISASAVVVERIHARERDLAVGEPEQRHARVALGELGGQLRAGAPDRRARSGARAPPAAVLLAERARQLVEIEEAELDQVRAEASAPHDLCAQRLLELLGVERACGDEQLAEPESPTRP